MREFETPILFLIFNRLDTAQEVFNQIILIKPKYLFVAADGPRDNKKGESEKCMEVRAILNQIDWNCKLKTLFRTENLGCGLAVSSAITWFFEQVEQGIILEDDCFPDLSFFTYCDELLEKYKNDESIHIISGTNLQNGIQRGDGSYYLSYYSITWGWATWGRAWRNFNYAIEGVEIAFESGLLDHVFQNKTEKKFWLNKLKKASADKKNIWDYQWFFAIWKNKGIVIAPNSNLIINIGFVNNGTHTFLKDSRREQSTLKSIEFPLKHPARTIIREADLYTYNNAFSHSPFRLFRLAKENGFFRVLKYAILSLRNSN
jgi:hypothetical protein